MNDTVATDKTPATEASKIRKIVRFATISFGTLLLVFTGAWLGHNLATLLIMRTESPLVLWSLCLALLVSGALAIFFAVDALKRGLELRMNLLFFYGSCALVMVSSVLGQWGVMVYLITQLL